MNVGSNPGAGGSDRDDGAGGDEEHSEDGDEVEAFVEDEVTDDGGVEDAKVIEI